MVVEPGEQRLESAFDAAALETLAAAAAALAERRPLDETLSMLAQAAADAPGAALAVLMLPLVAGGSPVSSLELMRRGSAFTEAERALARFAAAHARLALATHAAADGANGHVLERRDALRLAGE